MTVTTKRSIIALLLSLVLVVSLFTVSISATDAEATTEAVTNGATAEEGTDGATAEEGTEAGTAESESAAESESGDESESEDKTEKETEAEETEDEEAAEKAQTLIINGVIIAVIILIIVVVAVKFRQKLSAFFRSVKSELKKIVWSSKENTRKSFLVVAVVAVAVALLIFIMDYAFNTGIEMLASLFK